MKIEMRKMTPATAVRMASAGALALCTADVATAADLADLADRVDGLGVVLTDLGVGDAVHVRDLAANAAWSPVTDADLMIVHVVTIKAVEETPAAGAEGAAAAAPAAGGAEPEVIKKGKTDEAKADDKKK